MNGSHGPGRVRNDSRAVTCTPYAGRMVWFIILVLVVLAVGAYVFRVPLLAKLTGQSQNRVGGYLGRGRKR